MDSRIRGRAGYLLKVILRRMLRHAVCVVAAALAFGCMALAHGEPPSVTPPPVSWYDTARPSGLARFKATPKDETLTRLLTLRSRLRNLKMTWVWEGTDEVMTAFTAEVGGGTIRAESHINWTSPDREHWARIRLDNVGAREFLQVANVQVGARIDTAVSGRMDMRWRGLKMHALRESLDGEADFTLRRGAISHTRILDAFADFSGISALGKFEFDQGTVKATCTKGHVLVDPMELSGPLMKVRARGFSNLETDAMKLRFELWVLADAAKQSVKPEVRAGVGWLRGVAGKNDSGDFLQVPLPFSFEGTLSKPVAVPDFGGRTGTGE